MKTTSLCTILGYLISTALWSSQQLPTNSTQSPYKLSAKYLPNAIQIHDKVISGGQPDGEQAFRELKEFGIKTLISVDGAEPDLALATKYGFRYVHLPHGYDGIPPKRVAELAKAVREFEGPIYIHCHHGKHRSPAAAAAACVSAGLIAPTASSAILTLAGTNKNYRGLFESVANAKRMEDDVLDALEAEFPEIAKLTPMAEAMVELDQTHDHLKQFSMVGWTKLPTHPDMDPAHESLLLREHFAEMLRLESVAKNPEGFLKMLKESKADAESLEAAIRQWNRSIKSVPVPTGLTESLERISVNCTTCHRQYRD